MFRGVCKIQDRSYIDALARVQCYSTRQDDLVVVHVTSDYSSVIETPFKTEFLVILFKRYRNLTNKNLDLEFSDA